MRTDVKKCGAHNTLHGLRETCPRCAEARRAEVLAKAGEKPAAKPWASAWENVPPYPESRYEPNTLISHPRRNYITEIDQEEGRITVTSLTEAEARAKGFAWEDRPEAYEYRDAPKTPAGRWAVFEEFAAAGFFGPEAEPEPFSPETFCPPGRRYLEREGFSCSGGYDEGRGGQEVWRLWAAHEDGRKFREDIPYGRVKGNPAQAERFLYFSWGTVALDAGWIPTEEDCEEDDDY